MSIQSQVERINENISNTYNVLESAGATMPAEANSDNLAATAQTISAVLYGKEQSLTESQKAQARANIGAASAESDTPYTNLADPTSSDWSPSTRLTSVGGVDTLDGALTTNYIACKQGDILRVKGLDMKNPLPGGIHNPEICVYDSSKVQQATIYPASTHVDVCVEQNGVLTYTLTVSNSGGQLAIATSFVRVCGTPTGGDVIVTLNEEITTGDEERFSELEARTTSLENRVTELETKSDNETTDTTDTESIPSYWEDMVATKTETIKALQMAGGKNCVSFVWASDTHIPDSDADTSAGMGRTLHIGKVMAKMLDNCEIPFAVISGDVATRESKATEAQYNEALKKLPVHLAPVWGTDRLIMAMGNHDGCWGNSAGYYRHQLNPEKMWQTFFRGQALDFRRVFSDDGLYYYVDNVAQKTRFIILNSHFGGEYAEDGNGWAVNDRFHTYCYGQAQLDWLANVALDMPAGYGAVVITHIPPSIGKSVDTAQLTGIIKAYNDRTTFNGSYTSGVDGWSNSAVNANFANAVGEVIAVFAGHTHGDAAGMLDSMGCPQLTIMAAGATLNVTAQPDRVFGTDTETSLDVVTINRATKTIYCTRVGYGNDRVISYGNTEVNVYAVANSLTNCTNSNGASTATEGTSYSATITAKSGYVLSSVTVTMGGSPVTVTDGVINIAKVTGNIVITATAVEEATEEPDQIDYTNFADPTSDEWKQNYRCNSSGITACTGLTVTNIIEAKNTDTVYVYGFDMETVVSGQTPKVQYQTTRGTVVSNMNATSASWYIGKSDDGAYMYGGYGAAETCYYRFTGVPTNGEANVIIKIQRNGEWLTWG